jgi:hypothetical protein
MQAGSLLATVRRMLSDTGKSGWSDGTLVEYLSNAVRKVVGKRADLRLQADGSIWTPVEVTRLTQLIPMDASARESLVLLTAAQALSEDGDDRTNMERAMVYRNQAWAALGVQSDA